MATIVCVDDEPASGAVLAHALVKLGHRPILTDSGPEALSRIRSEPVDLIITDVQMPGMSGMDLLGVIQEEGYGIPVIIVTGYSSIDHAVVSIRGGAVDYLSKPIEPERLELAVSHALEFVRLRRENEAIRSELNTLKVGRAIVGQSAPLRRVLDTIHTVAPTRATVLIEGESGTGKELIARAIHDLSRRSEGPFLTVNCAALPEGLIESVLFGHEKGAFTGASERVPGAFERAHGGTLLLDEVSEMRLDLQAKLLRAIQEQEFERVGGREPVRVDVRFIATTNRDLETEVAGGRFRGDLYYRLRVVPLRAPTLRERPEDIPVLVQYFVRRGAEQLGVAVPPVAAETLALLQGLSWPGNVRELENAVERALVLSAGGPLTPEAFGGLRRERPLAGDGAEVYDLAELERRAIARALEATGGNRTRAARLLGISDRTLRNKLNSPRAGS